MHENAFRATRGQANQPIPNDVVWRIERSLNDPDCRDPSTPDTCASSRRARYDQTRLGWAAQTISTICYDNNARPRRYPSVCERRYSWGTAKEDYILPDAHTVIIRLAPERLTEAAEGDCAWSWQARKAGGRLETKTLKCKERLTIARVPYALDRAQSGVTVKVKLPDGREFIDGDVVVEDLLIVGLGDSFASGESNPDRPVTFSAAREMVYDPVNTREEMATRSLKPKEQAQQQYGLAAADDKFDAKRLPKRMMEDEEAGRILNPASRDFAAAFERRNARWVSQDCHRSQYGYPFRVGLQLALENRHRSVTLVSLACSGSEVTAGLFAEMDPREQHHEGKVRAQFDLLSDLLCRSPNSRTHAASYNLPFFRSGSPQVEMRQVTKSWCAPDQRKRPIDLVLLSIGGNDVGFGALALYSMTESASDIAPIVGWIGKEIRFGPQLALGYLDHLDERMKAVKDALRDGFGVDAGRVLQTSYEPIQFDEAGQVCGANPMLGLDVHPKLKMGRERLKETSDFMNVFLARLECISNGKKRADCPSNLATAAGTGFTLITDHLPAFAKRGICARDPKKALIDGAMMNIPRLSAATQSYKPYSPDAALPYAHRWRLFRTPNDAFMAANVHREGISPFDILQPAYAGLYSGAIHPTAEAHAIVADHVVRHARSVLEKRNGASPAR